MKYFPTANVTFTSQLSDDEIMDRLSSELEAKKMRYTDWKMDLFMNREQHRVFEGSMHNYHLKINRVVYNGLLFNTVISGRFKQHSFNTSADLKIELSTMNAILITVFMSGFGLFAVIAFFSLFGAHAKMWYFIPIIVFLTLYWGMLQGFKASARKDVDLLSKMCNAEDIQIK